MHGLRAARDGAWPTAGRVRDPWPGLYEPRINPHWSKPVPEGEPGNRHGRPIAALRSSRQGTHQFPGDNTDRSLPPTGGLHRPG